MVGSKVTGAIASVVAFSLLTGCAGSSLGNAVGRSLEADPQLEESPAFGSNAASDNSHSEAETSESASSDAQSRASQASTRDTEAASEDEQNRAEYSTEAAPEPGESDFIGPVWASKTATARQSQTDDESQASQSRLEGVPEDLQTYVRDLQTLDIIEISNSRNDQTNADGAGTQSSFNEPITRREYARWLFDAYNILYANAAEKRIRAGTGSDEPIFSDVPVGDPDFAAIQGLADAGIIPSALTGNSTAVTFRPDAPLAREDLILWKLPLDIRSALPETSPETVTETWGFQDTASIDPLALRAIAADFQLGDFSNIRRAFGYTTLFRPDKAVTRAEAAAVIWRFGSQTDGSSAAQVLSVKEAE